MNAPSKLICSKLIWLLIAWHKISRFSSDDKNSEIRPISFELIFLRPDFRENTCKTLNIDSFSNWIFPVLKTCKLFYCSSTEHRRSTFSSFLKVSGLHPSYYRSISQRLFNWRHAVSILTIVSSLNLICSFVIYLRLVCLLID